MQTASPAGFRALHAAGEFLILPNAWDAGSARVIAAAGASAVATTSAGLAWSRGYPDGNALPARVLEAAVTEIARVIGVPLTVDVEAGYTSEPSQAGELVVRIAGAGAAGVNLEDGSEPPELLAAKIAAVRRATAAAGIDVFVNARTDVYLRGLAPAEHAVELTIERARRYRDAGCDGVFVPGVRLPADIMAIAEAISPLPLNVMATSRLPPASLLRTLGVRRLSAGAALAAAAFGRTRALAAQFLADGASPALVDIDFDYGEMNRLFARG